MPRKEGDQPEQNPNRPSMDRRWSSAWNDINNLVDNPDWIYAKPDTINDPDFTPLMKFAARMVVEGIWTWDLVREFLDALYPRDFDNSGSRDNQ